MLHPMWSAVSPFSVSEGSKIKRSVGKKTKQTMIGSDCSKKRVNLDKPLSEARPLFTLLIAFYACLLCVSISVLWSLKHSMMTQQRTWQSQWNSLQSTMRVSGLTRRRTNGKTAKAVASSSSSSLSSQSNSGVQSTSLSQSDSSSSSQSSGPQKMKNRFDLMYSASLDIGTPKQHFEHMIYDTGSGDLWVMDEDYKGDGVPDKSWLHYYEPDESSTNRGDLGLWYIAYGSGSCSGERTMDSVSLDYSGSESYNVYFGVADSVNMNEIRKEPVDGILGFAMRSASSMNKKFNNNSRYGGYQTMAEAINGGVFTFYLSKHESNDFDHRRTHSMVAYDSLLESSELRNTYLKEKNNDKSELLSVKVETNYDYSVNGLWGVKIESISVRDTSVISDTANEDYNDKQFYGILDTGTSYLAMPENVYRLLMDENFNRRPDCSTDGDGSLGLYTCYDSVFPHKGLGSIDIKFRNSMNNDDENTYVTLTIEPEFYMSDDSSIAIMPLNSTIFIFGDTFLRKYMTTFDEPNMQVIIGEARLKDDDLQRITVVFAWIFGVLCFVFISVLVGQSVYVIKYR